MEIVGDRNIVCVMLIENLSVIILMVLIVCKNVGTVTIINSVVCLKFV